MLWVPGTQKYIELPLNAGSISTTESNFPYCFPLSLVTDPAWWACVSSAANIGVVDYNTGDLLPSWINGYIDIPNKTGVLYFDAPINNTKVLRVCAGATINTTESVAALTNSNFYEFWPLCESSGTIIYGINKSLTVVGPVTVGSVGKIFKACEFNGTSGMLKNETEVLGIRNRTVELIYNAVAPTEDSYSTPFSTGTATIKEYLYDVRASSYNRFSFDTTNDKGSTGILSGTYYYIIIVCKTTNKIDMYVNGALVQNDQAAGTMQATTNLLIGNIWNDSKTFHGTVEQFGVTSDLKTSGYAATKSAMLLTPSVFFGGDFTAKTPVSSGKKGSYFGTGRHTNGRLRNA